MVLFFTERDCFWRDAWSGWQQLSSCSWSQARHGRIVGGKTRVLSKGSMAGREVEAVTSRRRDGGGRRAASRVHSRQG